MEIVVASVGGQEIIQFLAALAVLPRTVLKNRMNWNLIHFPLKQKRRPLPFLLSLSFFCGQYFFLLTAILGLVFIIYLYSILRAICRPSDHSVVRPQADIRTQDGRLVLYSYEILYKALALFLYLKTFTLIFTKSQIHMDCVRVVNGSKNP